MSRKFNSLLIIIAATFGAVSMAHSGNRAIVTHRIVDPEIADFAVSFLHNRFDRDENWAGMLRGEVRNAELRYADTDLVLEGGSIRIIVVADGVWCGSAGCTAFMFRRTSMGFEYICGADMDSMENYVLLGKEHGYHPIVFGDGIIHWHKRQKYDSGQLCWVEEFRD